MALITGISLPELINYKHFRFVCKTSSDVVMGGVRMYQSRALKSFLILGLFTFQII